MEQTRADRLVGALAAGSGAVGAILTWQTYRQWSAAGEMGHMGAMHTTHPIWPLAGTLLAVGGIVGVYLLVRDQYTTAGAAATESETVGEESTQTNASPPDDEASTESSSASASEAATGRRRLLDMLPDDERRVLEPVLDSPGVTQIELRDRADFSKSKISQTVSELEQRGLLYRESQGRTFRVYPTEELEQSDSPVDN